MPLKTAFEIVAFIWDRIANYGTGEKKKQQKQKQNKYQMLILN